MAERPPEKGCGVSEQKHMKSHNSLLIVTGDPRDCWEEAVGHLPQAGQAQWPGSQGAQGSQFQCQCERLPCLSLGAEPLIGAMGIFSLTCVGTGQGELEEKS